MAVPPYQGNLKENTTMADFIKGRDICKSFYQNILDPVLSNIMHDAVLIGEGSDVLGYDQPVSTDHNWGIRITVFVPDESAVHDTKKKIMDAIPAVYMGRKIDKDIENSDITVTTVSKWLSDNLSIENINSLGYSEWLSFPQQHLLQFTGGVQY